MSSLGCPREAPYLWQRGIALYYAGRYRDCRAQFESHRTVNADDVENAAWHFLCVAAPSRRKRAFGAAAGRVRFPRADARDLRAVQGIDQRRGCPEGRRHVAAGRFYAHLYVGLYSEAIGDAARARSTSASPRSRSSRTPADTCTWSRSCTKARLNSKAVNSSETNSTWNAMYLEGKEYGRERHEEQCGTDVDPLGRPRTGARRWVLAALSAASAFARSRCGRRSGRWRDDARSRHEAGVRRIITGHNAQGCSYIIKDDRITGRRLSEPVQGDGRLAARLGAKR